MNMRNLIDENGHCEIPDGVTEIGDYEFAHCEELRSVRIPNTVKVIGNWTFCDCKSLTEVEIPYSVEEIGEFAFAHCIGLKTIRITGEPKEVGAFAFTGCRRLTTAFLAANVSGEWWQMCGKCAKLSWWSSEDGRRMLRRWGGTNEEIENGLAEMKAAMAQ